MTPLNPYANVPDLDLLAALVGAQRASRMLARSEGSLALVVQEASRSYDPRHRLPPSAIAAAVELIKRASLERARDASLLTSPAAVREYLKLHLAHVEFEVFMCLMVDCRHRLIEPVELFRGTLTQASVYPREVVKQALVFNAAALVLVHNHPSGVAEPSDADRTLTATLKSALALVDVRVLDHLIVAANDVCSMAERGLL